jgi:hypothetical protein
MVTAGSMRAKSWGRHVHDQLQLVEALERAAARAIGVAGSAIPGVLGAVEPMCVAALAPIQDLVGESARGLSIEAARRAKCSAGSPNAISDLGSSRTAE